MERRFAIVDVFTDKPLEGNPLAVVFDGAGLSDDAMQKIAGEFNLSETVFVTSFDAEAACAAIRIFTPQNELPFAGHPTVGTAVLLARELGQATDGDYALVLEEKVGAVSCSISLAVDSGRATFVLPKMPEPCGKTGDDQMVANALGLNLVDIGFDDHTTGQWSAGVPFSIIPVGSLDAISRIEPDMTVWADAFGEGHHNNAFVYCRECADPTNDYHARMFWPGIGIREDPATGGAIAAFSGVVMQNETPGDGVHAYTIEQGYEMGRPSLIRLELTVKNDALVEARIGGDVAMVAQGRLLI